MSKNPATEIGWKTGTLIPPYELANLVNSDSRRITSGQWFLPIRGLSFDGHDYIQQAMENGAAGFFYEENSKTKVPKQYLQIGIEVSDTIKAVQDLARWWREEINCQTIGITGSSGKTTVKEMVATMLADFAPTLKTEASLNNELGTPLTLCKLKQEHRFAVIEMGARHKGDIEFLSKIVLQDVGVLLNVGQAHLGEFGSVHDILKAKLEIAAAPIVVFPSDDQRIVSALERFPNKKLVSFGRSHQSEVGLVESSFDSKGRVEVSFMVQGQLIKIHTDFHHDSFPINAAACLAIGLALGLDPRACAESLASFRGIKGRFQTHQLRDKLLIDDSYNANPESMKAGLETLRKAYGQIKKTVILGDMLELGADSEAAHRALGGICATQLKPEQLLTVGPMARWIAEEAIKRGLEPGRVHVFSDVDQLLEKLEPFWSSCDLLYVKASHGIRLNRVVDSLLSQ